MALQRYRVGKPTKHPTPSSFESDDTVVFKLLSRRVKPPLQIIPMRTMKLLRATGGRIVYHTLIRVPLTKVYRFTEALKSSPVEDRLLSYLRSLAGKNLTTETVAVIAEQLWMRIRTADPSVQPPNATPTEDDGLRMSWIRNGYYLAIEVHADAHSTWYFRDTAARLSERGEIVSLESDLPISFLLRLRQIAT